jgi:hypothetical protein
MTRHWLREGEDSLSVVGLRVTVTRSMLFDVIAGVTVENGISPESQLESGVLDVAVATVAD